MSRDWEWEEQEDTEEVYVPPQEPDCSCGGMYRDTGIHTYVCTGCGTVGYYSQAAKDIAEGRDTRGAAGLRALSKAMGAELPPRTKNRGVSK